MRHHPWCPPTMSSPLDLSLFSMYLKACYSTGARETNDYTPHPQIVLCVVILTMRKCWGYPFFLNTLFREFMRHIWEVSKRGLDYKWGDLGFRLPIRLDWFWSLVFYFLTPAQYSRCQRLPWWKHQPVRVMVSRLIAVL